MFAGALARSAEDGRLRCVLAGRELGRRSTLQVEFAGAPFRDLCIQDEHGLIDPPGDFDQTVRGEM
jgi:hypothetical protein